MTKYRKFLIPTTSFFLIVFISSAFGRTVTISSPISPQQYADSIGIDKVVFTEDCGVTEIPDYAFMGCTSLRRVSLPQTLKKIGFQAFSECASLEIINFPDSLEDIGSNSFAYCRSLNHVLFPKNLKHIGHNAFSFCESLEEVSLPDSIKELESYAFSDCKSLKRAKLPANGFLLGELMFNCCDSLTELTAPSVEVPKFDCNSFIFDPIDTLAYQRCLLIVPVPSLRQYKSSDGWKLFQTIESSSLF